MVVGIGLDLVELERIQRLDERNDAFRMRVLTSRERLKYESLQGKRRHEFLAGRFAAKEAFSKALGTGIGARCAFQQIEVLNDASGRPFLRFSEEDVAGFVSITHTEQVAAAQVILLEWPTCWKDG